MDVRMECLSKNFGACEALKEVSLEIGAGLFGILGPAGSGKTTMMRILSTLLDRSGGSVFIDGIDIGKKNEIRKRIGYLPQEFSFYPSLTVFEAMDYLACLSGVKPGAARKKRILDLLELVSLENCMKWKAGMLEGGMKRRLGIAQALLHNPGLVLADEPMAGLEPEESGFISDILTGLAVRRTVVVASRNVGCLEGTCKMFAVLKGGELLFSGSAGDLLLRADLGSIAPPACLENAYRILMKEAI